MTLKEFIKENRELLDKYIAKAIGCEVAHLQYRNDEERRRWILNDEGLYQWARMEGVKI